MLFSSQRYCNLGTSLLNTMPTTKVFFECALIAFRVKKVCDITGDRILHGVMEFLKSISKYILFFTSFSQLR